MNHSSRVVFIGVPLIFSLISMGLYFSGIAPLQDIISPKLQGIPAHSWREFGLLEQTQNLLLLLTTGVLFRAMLKRPHTLEKSFFALGTVAMAFLFLEEMDYGIHLVHYFSPGKLETARMSWHNQINASGRENEHFLKIAADSAAIFCFVLLPLVKAKIKDIRLHSLAPTLWFLALMGLSLGVSELAHFLDHAGFGMINGIKGGLSNNISEFRETLTYYVYLLYALHLSRHAVLFLPASKATTHPELQSHMP